MVRAASGGTRQTGSMLEFLRRDRSPRMLAGTLVLAWVVMIATSQAGSNDQGALLAVCMAVVLIVGLAVTAFCLVKLAILALGR